MKRKWKSLSLYYKFSLTMILVGIFPMLLITIFISNRMMQEYRAAMVSQYEQMAGYLLDEIDLTLASYNTISQLPYNYNLPGKGINSAASFDNFRQMAQGEIYIGDDADAERESDMTAFLQYVCSVDSGIYAAHFMGVGGDGERLSFHYSPYNTYFRNEALFLELAGYEEMDLTDNQLIVIAPHGMGYYGSSSRQIVTIGRNYFDLRGTVGSRSYVGTLFLDVNLSVISSQVETVNFDSMEAIYVTDKAGNCFYSTQAALIGENIGDMLAEQKTEKNTLVISSVSQKYGFKVLAAVDTRQAFGNIQAIQRMMYVILGLSALVILLSSSYFSRKLTKPIHEMMDQMSKIEQGNFDIQLETGGEDEIGVLARRFNQMSRALKEYIDQSYKAKISQTEAELTALKSQIYPHFLYNTLEVIRMTALEEGNANVPRMIEALSEQMHYVIGFMQDMVPLEKEIDIVEKYVYLLNCRIREKILLTVSVRTGIQLQVPKLILQPIVENAYVHGLKKKAGGMIRIEVERRDTDGRKTLEITVMDNGVGMDGEALEGIRKLLAGDAPGVKNRDNWQSIGLKNVHDRIRYLYGEPYGIEIASTQGIGTLVTLCMPLAPGNENGDGYETDIGG